MPSTIASGQGHPVDLAVWGGFLYWLNANIQGSGAGQVMRAPLDGGSPVLIASGIWGAKSFVVTENTVYVVGDADLVAVPLDGGAQVSLANSMPYYPRTGLALVAGHLYWGTANGSSPGAIFRVPADGGTRTQAVSGRVYDVMTADSTDLFWGDPVSGVIEHFRLDGSGSSTLFSIQNAPWLILYPTQIAVDATHVYWANHGAGNPSSVVRGTRSGTNATALYTSPFSGMYGVAVDATHVYFSHQHKGFIMKVPKGGGPAKLVVSGQQSPYKIIVDDKFVYWTNYSFSERVMKVAK